MPHTPDDCARRILMVFKDFNVRAGECLMIGSFTNTSYRRLGAWTISTSA